MAVAVLIAATLFLCVSHERARAQPYEVTWYTVDGGGTMEAAGGTYEAGGTIGQPDAGKMTGGTYIVTGGFWVVTLPLPPKRPMAEDCATIDPGTRCIAYDPPGAHPCVTDADCAWESHCVPAPTDHPELGNVCYAPKTRYLSIARNPEQVDNTARRVKLDDGTVLGWVGEPYYVPPGSQHDGLCLADVVQDPHYENQWGCYSDDPPVSIDVVQVTGCEIAAGQTYVIQAILLGQNIGDEDNYSEVLELHTNTTWGDTVSTCAGNVCKPPNGVVGLADIMAAIGLYQGNPVAPITWLDIAPSNGSGTPNQYVGIGDIMGCIAGFQGEPYPGDGPLGCSP